MNKIPIDKTMVDLIRSVHKDLPVLNEQDVLSIYDLLNSEDSEVQMTGVSILDTCNYFETPKLLYRLYESVDIDINIDENDTFASIIRLLYSDSDRYKKESSIEMKDYDNYLIQKLNERINNK